MSFKNVYIILIVTFCQWLMPENSAHLTRYQRSLGMKKLKLWPNGIVPYVIEDIDKSKTKEYTEMFSKIDVLIIKKAISIIEEETCIRFQDMTSRENSRNAVDKHIIRIKGRGQRGCYSHLGMASNKNQVLRLGPTCRTVGQILHELLHALGVMHEIMRPDRDQYVTLHEENIDKSYLAEFMKIKEHQSILADRKFDFQSISLYDPFTFTSNGNPVWEPVVNLDNVPLFSISEKYLSFEDTVGLNRLYQCDKNCSNKSTLCGPGEFRNKHCICQNESQYAYERCHDDVNQTAYCTRFAVPHCRYTCGRCFRAGSMGISTPPKKLCHDVETELCENYVKEGYCHFDGWTKLNCQYSCKLCPSPDVVNRQVETGDVRAYLEAYRKGDCFNRYDDLRCEVFSQRGDCRTNPGFMSSQCTQSCGLCPDKEKQQKNANRTLYSHSTSQPVPCHNYIDDHRCDALAKEGKCYGTTLKQCLGSCNKCGDDYPRQTTENTANLVTESMNSTISSVPIKCEDQSPLCSYYKTSDQCQTNKVIKLEICPETCRSCESKCKDLDTPSFCEDLVQRGYCNRSKAYAERCMRSCRLCQDDMITDSNSVISMKSRTTLPTFVTDVSPVPVATTKTIIGPTVSSAATTEMTTSDIVNTVSTNTIKPTVASLNMTPKVAKNSVLLRRKPSQMPNMSVSEHFYLQNIHLTNRNALIYRQHHHAYHGE
ncbi:unnamed protein product [Heterobilharzia americana]|nr:unnamed protein product [Heterobilharzia americana]